ncbi:MAG TPA: hypothetical protein DCY54_04205 [Parachlamydiales bacterium]|nr:MAG: hypothetical protein A2Z85_02540 [Chlamydiae bacterium GWA2_50_15]OGN58149.1 MAG: hypothetical protein A3D18_05885 [Chlamydiae bacterium RIFCSPHIGHO2_02_FULL_49_29]OGN67969.1 MAG: hypothetical protein A3I15_06445 [Chlamydiae bacterium RIFCSPLOWO2_02_FULL_49_12]HAZ15816.1 hypothetical protein [Parachlamydiales bacterium]
MIDHLIEIVFKNISRKKIGALLKDLSSNGQKIASYHFTCEPVAINWSLEKSIEKAFSGTKKFGLFINLNELVRDGINFPNCGIAVYKYENTINLEINIQLSDLKDFKFENLTKSLIQLAKSIATNYHINDYYCGLEPAQDTKTRLFTNEEIGPFFLIT